MKNNDILKAICSDRKNITVSINRDTFDETDKGSAQILEKFD